jgi:hypothetical protein
MRYLSKRYEERLRLRTLEAFPRKQGFLQTVCCQEMGVILTECPSKPYLYSQRKDSTITGEERAARHLSSQERCLVTSVT